MRLTQQSVRNIRDADVACVVSMDWGFCATDRNQSDAWAIRWFRNGRVGYGLSGDGGIMLYPSEAAAFRALARIREKVEEA